MALITDPDSLTDSAANDNSQPVYINTSTQRIKLVVTGALSPNCAQVLVGLTASSRGYAESGNEDASAVRRAQAARAESDERPPRALGREQRLLEPLPSELRTEAAPARLGEGVVERLQPR